MFTYQASSTKDTKEQYDNDGYIIVPTLISDKKLNVLEESLMNRLGLDGEQDLIEGMRQLEHKNKKEFYQLCTQEIWFTIAALTLMADEGITRQVARFCDELPEQLSPVGHGLIWNDPACPRLHTRWHQEAAYYPGLKNVVSVWFPLAYDLTPECGSMLVARGSHKQYIDCQKQSQQGGVTHMEIDEQVVKRFDVVPCTLKRGDAIIFHQNIIHKTGVNHTQRPRLSGVIRYANLNTEAKKTPYWLINPNF